MKKSAALLLSLIVALQPATVSASLLDRIAQIENELGVAPDDNASLDNRLGAIEEVLGKTSDTDQTLQDRVKVLESELEIGGAISEDAETGNEESALTVGYLLDEIKPYQTPDYYAEQADIQLDDSVHGRGFTCMGYGNDGEGAVTFFQMDDRFLRVFLTAGIIDDNPAGNEAVFTFYGDGDILKTVHIKPDGKPVDCVLDVSGCWQLEVSVEDGSQSEQDSGIYARSEERRVGKECRSRWSPYH